MNHRSSVESVLDDIKTGEVMLLRDKSTGNLLTGWVVSGIEMARARFRRFSGTAGTRDRDAKGDSQVKKSKAESTNARAEDGPTRSSVEAPVMGAERRGRIASVESHANSLGG